MEETNAAVRRRQKAATAGRYEGKRLEHRHKAQSFIDSKALDDLETEVFETGLYENIDVSRGSDPSVMAAEMIYS